jgi:hypothetical protein
MFRFERPAKPVVGLLEVFGLIGLGLLLTARFVPLARLPFWGCALRKHTGIPCLSCGMNRAFDWFLRGRFLDSLAVNPLGFLLAIAAVIGLLYLAARPWRPPRLVLELTAGQKRWVRIGAVGLLAADWGYLIARAFIQGT